MDVDHFAPHDTEVAAGHTLSWLQIIRLGLVQACLGSVVVLTTSTLNRVMVVELALAAAIPGLLVGLHYAVQISRPYWGHGSDIGGSRTRFILGGLALLGTAAVAAASTTLLFEQNFALGLVVALVAYTAIGLGIGASGTSLLALLASQTAPARRPAAATLTWIMMLVGIIATSIIVGSTLDPYSHERLIIITAITGVVVLLIAMLAVMGLESPSKAGMKQKTSRQEMTFRDKLADVWRDPDARLFTIFVFLSMLAYSTQDLILEPFGGLLFDMTPGETTKLSGVQHGGVLGGMVLVGLMGSLLARKYPSILRVFIITGCLLSAVALAFLGLAATVAPDWPLRENVFLLGVANGVFAVASIGTMMSLAGEGKGRCEGIRMGVWGAAQAISFGIGGFLGTVLLDIFQSLFDRHEIAFAIVFNIEAILFFSAAVLAIRINAGQTQELNSLSAEHSVT